jgi:anti-sigma B factor antagonist
VEVFINQQEDVQIFKITGKLDSYTSGDLGKQLMPSIESGNKKIIIDFSELDYISSAGLRTLLLAAKKIKQSEGKILLAELKEHITQVFQIAGFTAIFPIFPSVSKAKENF